MREYQIISRDHRVLSTVTAKNRKDAAAAYRFATAPPVPPFRVRRAD